MPRVNEHELEKESFRRTVKATLLGSLIVIFMVAILSITIDYIEKNFEFARISKMKKDVDKIFEWELTNQIDKTDFYIILPNSYGNDIIDDYVEELGSKKDYRLVNIQFNRNHIVYEFIKTYKNRKEN